jgi:hypothetical protein
LLVFAGTRSSLPQSTAYTASERKRWHDDQGQNNVSKGGGPTTAQRFAMIGVACFASFPCEVDVMESLKIVLLCIVSAMLYGILHDQVTTRICVEYFTIGHPPIFQTEEPTILAIGWGILATWWVGALLSFLAAPACRLGAWPKLDAAQLIRPITVLLIVMFCSSLLAGIAGYFAAKAGIIRLFGSLAYRVSVAKHDAFLADLWAHNAAYGVGALGGVVVCVRAVLQRRRLAETASTK